MQPDDAGMAAAGQTRGLHEFGIAEGQRLGPGKAGIGRPSGDGDGDDDLPLREDDSDAAFHVDFLEEEPTSH